MPDEKDQLIDQLGIRLAYLANEWRGFHSRRQYHQAAMKVEKYHSIFAQLWALGWDGGDLLPDSELPDELMPKYYIEKWQKIRGKVEVTAIRFMATCENGHDFIFHALPAMGYGSLLARTKKLESALIEPSDSLDSVSEIVDEIMTEAGRVDRGEIINKRECFQGVLGMVFDKSPSGLPYLLNTLYCPVCGSTKTLSYDTVNPEQIDKLMIPEVTYTAWDALDVEERRRRLKDALKEIGCL